MPLETFFCCSSICFVMYKVGLVSVRFDVIDERTARAKSIACYARVQRSLFENGTRVFFETGLVSLEVVRARRFVCFREVCMFIFFFDDLFRNKLFVRFEAWTFVSNCVREYVDVVVFVSFLTNSLVPTTVLRA